MMTGRSIYRWVEAATLSLLMGLLPTTTVAITPAGTLIHATGAASYSAPDGTAMPTSTSNTVIITISQIGGVSISAVSQTESAEQGACIDFPLTVSNAGNGSDTFGLAAVSENGWPVVVYRDDNGDAVRQSA